MAAAAFSADICVTDLPTRDRDLPCKCRKNSVLADLGGTVCALARIKPPYWGAARRGIREPELSQQSNENRGSKLECTPGM